MDYSRAKSPNIGNVLNARRLARRKLQRSARRDQEKLEAEKKVNINPWQIMCKEPSVGDECNEGLNEGENFIKRSFLFSRLKAPPPPAPHLFPTSCNFWTFAVHSRLGTYYSFYSVFKR